MPSANQSFSVPAEHAGKTVAALLRLHMPGQTWTQVRGLVAARRVKINGELWLDDARRLKAGDSVEVLAQSEKTPAILVDPIPIRYIDEHIVVVEKPSGISTVRHPLERDWLEERRLLILTLDDLVLQQIGMRLARKKHEPRPRLRIVQRLDKETSGLVVFARTVDAERGLGMQFRRHTVTRRYLAIVAGIVTPQTIRSTLVRDRGDGRRGSRPGPPSPSGRGVGGEGKLGLPSPSGRGVGGEGKLGLPSPSGRGVGGEGKLGLPSPSGRGVGGEGKDAITHVTVEESFAGYTLLSCKLETGRTHQIRIHLSELGHPVCGERVYNRRFNGDEMPDESGAPRLALHAAELGFTHPISEKAMHWDMPPPPDLRAFLDRLRGKN